jgi:hypothetical protein
VPINLPTVVPPAPRLMQLQRKFAAATKFQSAVRLFLQRARFRPLIHLARVVKEIEWARLSRICFKIQRQWRCLQCVACGLLAEPAHCCCQGGGGGREVLVRLGLVGRWASVSVACM